MELKFYIVNECESYRDIDAYIREDDGAEWLFRIYMDKERGQIVACEPRWSPDPHEDFGDEGQKTPPVEVLRLLDQHRPEIEKTLNA